ncbi:MAG: hypothetical protein ACQGVK_23190 [Myxococcota bacterium]
MSRHPLVASLAVFGLLALLATAPAEAGRKQSQTQTEATFLGWDADAHTITVKIRRTGRGKGPKLPPQLRIKRGEEVTFKVKETGSVLSRTVVKSKLGTRMSFEDLKPGAKVFVFWVPDQQDENARFVRSISVFLNAQDWAGTHEEIEPPAAAE